MSSVPNDNDISIFILAGGKSSRFGSDKSLYPYRGRPLIEYVIETVKPVSPRLFIVANGSSRFRHLGIPCYADLVENIGPLGGLYTALRKCGTGYALVLGCDMPYVSRALIEHMISIRNGSDAVIPFINGWYEPLHALYSTRCIPHIEQHIREGSRRIASFYNRIKLRTMDEDEVKRYADPGKTFMNFNSPQELRD